MGERIRPLELYMSVTKFLGAAGRVWPEAVVEEHDGQWDTEPVANALFREWKDGQGFFVYASPAMQAAWGKQGLTPETDPGMVYILIEPPTDSRARLLVVRGVDTTVQAIVLEALRP